ncbi:hypothetical protein GCM10009530_63000 [Microbispora corallina]|uniref:DUF2637 domain-containing protein n=2 Tax=Microbispora corallina TaxID=83302 RepID=A0ABQ4GCM3_9ACTN|nr:DUF2637 domain-containing protein [Microbispora corallina]GIH44800.1 hypothetical protein Mco01_78000 [Microbispora corallina]
MGAGGDRLIRAAAIAVLLGVAAAAAYVSYHHFYKLAVALGERHDMAVLYPAMSDGVIAMASLVMVYCSRRSLPVPALAWVALALGGVVTLVANVAYGWQGGAGSRLLSALAPVAFVGAYELLMWLVRTGRRTTQPPAERVVEKVVYRDREVPVEVVQVERVLPRDRYEAAAWEYEDSLTPGRRRAGRRSLASHWRITEREAEQIQADVRADRAGETTEEDSNTQPSAPPAADLDQPAEERGGEPATGPQNSIPGPRSDRPVRWGDLVAAANGQGPAGGGE